MRNSEIYTEQNSDNMFSALIDSVSERVAERICSRIEERLQQTQQSLQQEMQQLQQSLQAPIYEKAQNAVNEIAKAKGLSVVFEKNSLLYFDPSQGVDLTPEARLMLNIPEGRTLASLQAELQAKAQAAQGMAQ